MFIPRVIRIRNWRRNDLVNLYKLAGYDENDDINVDILARVLSKRLEYLYDGEFKDVPEKLLAYGANGDSIFELFNSWISTDNPKAMFRDLNVLIKHGLDKEKAKEFVEKILKEDSTSFFEETITKYQEELKKLGIDTNKYLATYLDLEHEFILADFKALPENVTVDNFIENYVSMQNILDYTNDGFAAFIETFVDFGGHTNVLVDKFLKEIGYSSRREDSLALAELIWHGADNIDINKFAESAPASAMNSEEKDFIRGILVTKHADKRLIQRFVA
ncbi:hypothetical protein IKW73_00665 [Candidatus Saccharibacteria bacterium]|nr:hypothetical protein [Candidatus Saccharibacteria bacterium]